MLNEAQDLVGIADLVIIPGDDLHERIGQRDTGLGVYVPLVPPVSLRTLYG